MASHNFETLSREILRLSRATSWGAACLEWALVGIEEIEGEPETCLCSHHPIRQVCTIRNRHTKHEVDVGNECVKRFLGIRSDKVFACIQRIRKDPSKSINPDALDLFYKKGLFNDREHDFLRDTMRKRNLTPKQLAWRVQLNNKILRAIARKGFQGH